MEFIAMTVIFVLLDIITVKGLKILYPKFCRRHRLAIKRAFIIQSAVMAAVLLSGMLLEHEVRDYRLFAWYYCMFGAIVTVYMPKMLYALSLAVDGLLSRAGKLYRRHFDRFPRDSRHTVARIGFWAGLCTACLIVTGMVYGRYHYTVDHVEITASSLPPAFNGYRIVQISDFHAGSDVRAVKSARRVAAMISSEEPDLIVFTGDMVNNFAEEAAALVPVFSELKARDGKYAVLGNHDYGGYFEWDSPADSTANIEALKSVIEQMGFVLLNNRSTVITQYNSERIALAGIENWGSRKRYPKRGNLDRAIDGVRNIPFKILLSHDPSFWLEYVEGKTDVALTLSGHTHGMQMGIKLGKKRYNPLTRLRFSHLAGLYRTGKQYLYVNRGLGIIGFPGRIGMPPEITVITLLKDKATETQ